MPTQVQFRRGTTAQNNNFTGALAEISVDTDLNVIRVHNGSTQGGFALAGTSAAQTLSNKVYQGTSVSVTGDVTGGNIITSGVVSATGNVAGGNVTTTGVFAGSGAQLTSIPGGNVSGTVATATTAGTVTTAAQPNITSVGTLSSLSVTGNITASYIIGNGSQLTGLPEGYTNSNVVTLLSSFGSNTISTTGNVTSGGITLSGNTISSAGATLTIDPAASGSTGNVIIAGNLSVQGTTTTYDSTTVTINDLLFSVANNAATAAAANGGGLEVGPAGASYATWTYDQPNSRWTTALGINATANITGGNIVTGGVFAGSGAQLTNVPADNITGTTLASSVVTSSLTTVGALNSGSITSGFGAIDIGTDTVTCGGIVNSNANGIGNIGSSTTYFNTVFAKATSAQYADLAEMYVADAKYSPGTVVEFGGNFEITQTTSSCSTAVAGIISTNPSYLMNATQSGEHVLPVALTGRVPCRVLGPVKKGDVLISSSIPGVAQRIGTDWQPGCTVGKAMENITDDEIQTIEVAVGRL